MPALKNFALVGGTALSLLYGHRKSVDLDLFSAEGFDNDVILDVLTSKFGKMFDNRTSTPQFGIFSFINEIKVDMVRHPHPLIRERKHVNSIRMFSVEDIIAMKVQAILQRGRKKDFWDIAELLSHFTVADFAKFHKEKYSSQNLMITVPQAISYFADAEEDVDPVSLKSQTWDQVKDSIRNKVREYLA